MKSNPRLFRVSFLILVLIIVIPLFLSYNESGWISCYLSPSENLNFKVDLKDQIAIVTGSNTGQTIID